MVGQHMTAFVENESGSLSGPGPHFHNAFAQSADPGFHGQGLCVFAHLEEAIVAGDQIVGLPFPRFIEFHGADDPGGG